MARAVSYIEAMTPEHLKPAAVRSGIDVALWFQARAAAERGRLSPQKLRCLLYLAQAFYAAARNGQRLMPACFHAGANGPFDPTLDLVLTCGLARPPTPVLSPQVEAILAALWAQYGAIPGPGLARLIAVDGVTGPQRASNPDGEIPVPVMAEIYAKALSEPSPPAVAAPTAQPETKRPHPATVSAPPAPAGVPVRTVAEAAAAPTTGPSPQPSRLPPVERIRFTLDGREVKPWTPRRRVPPKKS